MWIWMKFWRLTKLLWIWYKQNASILPDIHFLVMEKECDEKRHRQAMCFFPSLNIYPPLWPVEAVLQVLQWRAITHIMQFLWFGNKSWKTKMLSVFTFWHILCRTNLGRWQTITFWDTNVCCIEILRFPWQWFVLGRLGYDMMQSSRLVLIF